MHKTLSITNLQKSNTHDICLEDFIIVTELWTFVAISSPIMIFLGLKHGLDVDHITAIDNLVRLHNASRGARWVGTGFSVGHMVSVIAEMVLIIYVIGSVTRVDQLSFWGGIIGAIALGTIGGVNIYSMKRWGKTGSAILASMILARTGMLGPFGSALVTGIVFGLGFDTATQISAITLSAVVSATLGVQAALVLAGFFAIGMIPVDTLDSILLRSAFSRIFNTKGFQYMSYALSAAAITVAAVASYGVITGSEVLPELTGPVLAATIIAISFGYGFATKKKTQVLQTSKPKDHFHHSHEPEKE
jgi:high-affinity nickel-transport protein